MGTRIDSVGERIDRILSNTDGAALDSLTEIASAFQTADQGLVQNVETLTKTSQHDRDAIRSIATANRLVIGDHVALKTTANTVLAAINELVDEQNDLPSNAATKAEVQAVEAKVTTVRNRVDGVGPAALWRETSNPWRVIYKPRRHIGERTCTPRRHRQNRNGIRVEGADMDSLPWAEHRAHEPDVIVGARAAWVRQLFLWGGVWVGDRVFVTQTAVLRRKDAPGAVVANGGTVEGVQPFGGNTLAAWHRYYKDLTGNDIEVHNLFVVPNDFETTLAFSELGSAGLLATDAKETVVAAINEVLRKVDEGLARHGEEAVLRNRVDVGRPAGHAGPERTGSAGRQQEIVEAFQGSDAI